MKKMQYQQVFAVKYISEHMFKSLKEGDVFLFYTDTEDRYFFIYWNNFLKMKHHIHILFQGLMFKDMECK